MRNDKVAAQTEVVEITMSTLSGYSMTYAESIHVVRMLRSLIHGFATLESAGGFGIPLDRDETFQRLLHIFLQGLATERNVR